MFGINHGSSDKVKEYMSSCGFSDSIIGYYMWGKLDYEYNDNCVYILSHIPTKYANTYSDDDNKIDIYHKLSMYDMSTCVLLVTLKAIKYEGDIFLKLETDYGNRLLRYYKFLESNLIESTIPTSHTSVEINYLEALALFGTPDMLSDYITKLTEFPQKTVGIARCLKTIGIQIDNIHNMENRMLIIRFMNEYGENGKLEL